jgi:2-dehydropantoate 2-reductase
MKILMFGRGVIATVYGWALQKSGHTVDFYVRPGRVAEYGNTLTMTLYDLRTKLTGMLVEESWKISLREDLPADHDYDLIILSVQHYRFAQAAAFIGPRVGQATVLIFNNFWTDPQLAAGAIPASQLAWGFPGAGGGFDERGILRGSLMPLVQFGTFGTQPSARELAVRELFVKSGFKLQEQPDFKGWLWIHFAMNAGILAQILQTGSAQGVTGSYAQLKEAMRNVRELLPLLVARGVDLKAHGASAAPFKLPASAIALALFLISKLSRPVRFVLESHTNPEELRRTCRDALDEARLLGVRVPRLEAAEAFFPSQAAASNFN